MARSDRITKTDARNLIRAIKKGEIVPEDFPGAGFAAFRLLIRSIRATFNVSNARTA